MNTMNYPIRVDHGRGRLTYSRFPGVTFHKHKRRWLASFYRRSKRTYLGSFPPTPAGERAAARAVADERRWTSPFQ
jgi:hypothetical protein